MAAICGRRARSRPVACISTVCVWCSGAVRTQKNEPEIWIVGAAEYEAFLEFVEEQGETEEFLNTVEDMATEAERIPDSGRSGAKMRRYRLDASAVRKLALPGNAYYDIDATPKEVLGLLQADGISEGLSPEYSKEQFTVTTGDYGIIRTDFTVEEIYQMEDSIWLILDYDYNNGKLHELRIVPRQGRRTGASDLAGTCTAGWSASKSNADAAAFCRTDSGCDGGESDGTGAWRIYLYRMVQRGSGAAAVYAAGRKPAVDHCIRCFLYWNQHPALSGKRPGLSLVMILGL